MRFWKLTNPKVYKVVQQAKKIKMEFHSKSEGRTAGHSVVQVQSEGLHYQN